VTSVPKRRERVQVLRGGHWEEGVAITSGTLGARVRLDSGAVVFLARIGRRRWRYPEQRTSGPWPPVRKR
jgi:hypothetical protein